jgi:hypothetical protein
MEKHGREKKHCVKHTEGRITPAALWRHASTRSRFSNAVSWTPAACKFVFVASATLAE